MIKPVIALLVALLTRQHVFGIDGRPVLCVPESDLNPDLLAFNDESTQLKPGNGHTPGFGGFFSLREMGDRFGSAYLSQSAQRHPITPRSGIAIAILKIALPNPNTFVIGTCNYSTISAGPYQGAEIRECTRVFMTDGFMVDYQFAQENAGLIKQFDAFLKDKVAQWQNNCSKAI